MYSTYTEEERKARESTADQRAAVAKAVLEYYLEHGESARREEIQAMVKGVVSAARLTDALNHAVGISYDTFGRLCKYRPNNSALRAEVLRLRAAASKEG